MTRKIIVLFDRIVGYASHLTRGVFTAPFAFPSPFAEQAKMIIPLRDQLQWVYGMTGEAKGGWK